MASSFAAVLCADLPIFGAGDGEAPRSIHLLPAGEIATVDGRGPYRVADAPALIAASLGKGARLPIDENHATDLAAPQGHPAPARGWIVALHARPDGIWGDVEWTEAGRELVLGRAYRNISPVIAHRPDGVVTGILRASLVNRPNLRGLVALHAEATAPNALLDRLRSALGLPPHARDEECLRLIGTLRAAAVAQSKEHQQFMAELRGLVGIAADAPDRLVLKKLEAWRAQLAAVADATGLQASADGAAVLQAVRTLRDPAKFVSTDIVVALNAELVQTRASIARERAERCVDEAIRAGKMTAPARMRGHYIERHMADSAAVELELGMMMSLHGRGLPSAVPPFGLGTANGLDGEEEKIVSLMGLDPKAYAQMRATVARQQETE